MNNEFDLKEITLNDEADIADVNNNFQDIKAKALIKPDSQGTAGQVLTKDNSGGYDWKDTNFIVDDEFDPVSENAQSGIAVAEALGAKYNEMATELQDYTPHPKYTYYGFKDTSSGYTYVKKIDTDTVQGYSIIIAADFDSAGGYGFIKEGNPEVYPGQLIWYDVTGTIEDNITTVNSLKSFAAISAEYANDNKQDTLVSGTNIKTINNQSILGSGNIAIGGNDPVYQLIDTIDIPEDVGLVQKTGLNLNRVLVEIITTGSTVNKNGYLRVGTGTTPDTLSSIACFVHNYFYIANKTTHYFYEVVKDSTGFFHGTLGGGQTDPGHSNIGICSLKYLPNETIKTLTFECSVGIYAGCQFKIWGVEA